MRREKLIPPLIPGPGVDPEVLGLDHRLSESFLGNKAPPFVSKASFFCPYGSSCSEVLPAASCSLTG